MSATVAAADAAYQGVPGAYSEQAAWALAGPGASLLPCPLLSDVFDAVRRGRARTGVIPVENSLVGTVPRAYELLLEHDFTAVGETTVRIDHVLIGRPGMRADGVRRVLSHPVALDQCRRFIELNKLEALAVFDTAGAVGMVMADGAIDTAAIASRRAAELHNAAILATGIQDSDQNWTRFLSVRPRAAALPAVARKVIVAFRLPHESGSLSRALQCVAAHGLNLTKIESRPIPGRPFEYAFLIELTCEGAPAWHEWIVAFERVTTDVRWMGAY